MDVDQIKRRAVRRAKGKGNSLEGTLQTWHHNRYKPWQGVRFEDRTIGDLLEEMFFDLAVMAEDMRARVDDLDPVQLEKLAGIEEALMEERNVLSGLSESDSVEVWETAHVTGDPLVDKWEREVASKQTPDLDEVA
jgi:hypothetical protein